MIKTQASHADEDAAQKIEERERDMLLINSIKYNEKNNKKQYVSREYINNLLDIDFIRPIPDFTGYYISRSGTVISVRQNQARIMKISLNYNGYFRVQLSIGNHRKKMYIHRLVAHAFIPNPNNYPMINHMNEIKTDNYVNNLEWCTAKHNVNYGGRAIRFSAKVSKPVFKMKGNTILSLYSSATETKRDGYISSLVSACAIGKRKHHKGYQWIFVSDFFGVPVGIEIQDNKSFVHV